MKENKVINGYSDNEIQLLFASDQQYGPEMETEY